MQLNKTLNVLRHDGLGKGFPDPLINFPFGILTNRSYADQYEKQRK